MAEEQEVSRGRVEGGEFFDGAQEDACVAFEADVVGLGVERCCLHQEAAFAHADFDVDGVLVAEALLPAALPGCGVLFYVGARGDCFCGSGDVS